MKCEGIVPEETRATGSEMVEQEDGTFERVVHTETTPEHPCEEEGTLLARDIREVTCDYGSSHFVRVADHLWCPTHARPGAVFHVDGKVTQHPYMSPDEYQEG